uniref:Uncharacterized protein n=1 Tax=Arundo donax TaxID=35708 RepID=A0A0A8ZDK9_ARUDO
MCGYGARSVEGSVRFLQKILVTIFQPRGSPRTEAPPMLCRTQETRWWF